MCLQAYKYTMRYWPEIKNVADISQSPAENPGEQHIHDIINEAVPVSIKLSGITTESAKDEKIKETNHHPSIKLKMNLQHREIPY